ncbi:MAG TPA: hypothetical protein VMF89_08730 [Polyangiales bacterium]|nr:hypothetical protein [Polyangiales bacterium]
MPKLPANYVKAPSFDNPLRATSTLKAGIERTLQLVLDEATWNALKAASAAEGIEAEALVLRALERHLALLDQNAIAAPPEPPPSKRAQLLDQLYDQFVRRSWVQCVMTMRAILRESRA